MDVSSRHPTRLPGARLRAVRYPANLTQPDHMHENTTLTLVLGGTLEEDVGSAHEEAGALSVVFKPAGTPHANRMGPGGASTLQLSLEPGVLDGPDCELGPGDWGWTHGGPVARRFLALVDGARAVESDTDLEGRLFDLLATVRDDSGEEASVRGAPDWLVRVSEELDDTFADPRRVRDLAADASVHPVALARAHRRHFGCSITERLKSRRISEAAALLGGRDLPISSVAYRTGFADQSHLTRVFRSETGLTPGAYRSLVTD